MAWPAGAMASGGESFQENDSAHSKRPVRLDGHLSSEHQCHGQENAGIVPVTRRLWAVCEEKAAQMRGRLDAMLSREA